MHRLPAFATGVARHTDRLPTFAHRSFALPCRMVTPMGLQGLPIVAAEAAEGKGSDSRATATALTTKYRRLDKRAPGMIHLSVTPQPSPETSTLRGIRERITAAQCSTTKGH